MESAFAWLGQIFDALLQFFPRRVIVRATHGGVKWGWRGGVKELKPGVRIYWPLLSEVEIVVTARQTVNTRTQALITRDGRTVAVGGVVIYSISDVIQSIGKLNFDPTDTVGDISQAAIVQVITSMTFEEIMAGVSTTVEEALTHRCRKSLRQYGVYVHRAALTDFSPSKAINLLGTQGNQVFN